MQSMGIAGMKHSFTSGFSMQEAIKRIGGFLLASLFDVADIEWI
jgi:hypothetical protein